MSITIIYCYSEYVSHFKHPPITWLCKVQMKEIPLRTIQTLFVSCLPKEKHHNSNKQVSQLQNKTYFHLVEFGFREAGHAQGKHNKKSLTVKLCCKWHRCCKIDSKWFNDIWKSRDKVFKCRYVYRQWLKSLQDNGRAVMCMWRSSKIFSRDISSQSLACTFQN